MKDILAPEQRMLLETFCRRNTLLAFDYDGTLAPIVADPKTAFLRPQTREVLTQLAQRSAVTVITGRSRLDAMRLLEGVPSVEVMGNHGAESDGARPEQYVRRVAGWRDAIHAQLSDLAGAVVEDKRYSLAIHYRHCIDQRSAKTLVQKAAAALDGARLIGGKAVINVVPREAPDKGVALLRLRARLNCSRALYVGDDDTDEDVFALGDSEAVLGIRVGKSEESAADCFVSDQAAVDDLLRLMLQLGNSE